MVAWSRSVGNLMGGPGDPPHCMIRIVSLFLFLPLLAGAALLPESLGEFERKSVEPYTPAERDLYIEFGFEEGETAHYATEAGQSVDITARRCQDPTGAFAVFLWLQPEEGTEQPYGEGAVRSGDRTLIRFGNYVIELQGAEPIDEHIELMLAFLPRVQMTAPPPLLAYFPNDQIVPYSARHVLGPASLEQIAPEISPSIAAFHFGTEAHYGRYATPNGEHKLLLFSYPTPQIARDQFEAFNELGDVVAKRSGPLVAVVPNPPSADEAQRLLARVRYAAEVTPDHREPTRSENLGTLLVDIIIFCGLLVILMIVGGGIVAGTRILAGQYAPSSILASPDEGNILRLDIEKH